MEIFLSKMVADSVSKQKKAVGLALSGFLVGELRPGKIGGENPRGNTALFVLLYLSLHLPEPGLPSRFRLGSTFFGFYTVVEIAIAAAIFLLSMTWSFYEGQLKSVLNLRVINWSSIERLGLAPRIGVFFSNAVFQRFAFPVLSLAAAISLFAPWLGPQPQAIRGFEILLPNKPLGAAIYRIAPSIQVEMRVQLGIGLVFVLLAATSWLLGRNRGEAVRRASSYVGLFVLGLVLNLIVYFALFYYRMDKEVLGIILSSAEAANLKGGYGIPLMLRVPMYGSYIFLSSVTFLSLLVNIGPNSASVRNGLALPELKTKLRELSLQYGEVRLRGKAVRCCAPAEWLTRHPRKRAVEQPSVAIWQPQKTQRMREVGRWRAPRGCYRGTC